MASTYLSRTPSSSGNRRKFTISMWVKRIKLGVDSWLVQAGASGSEFDIRFTTADQIRFSTWDGSNGYGMITTRVFRDTSAWMHLVFQYDSAQATDTNRNKIYVNGEQISPSDTSAYNAGKHPPQNYDNPSWNNTTAFRINDVTWTSSSPKDAVYSHIHHTDGYAYDASDFGETDSTSGIWTPKTSPSVTYGTNGFFLKFENSAAMGTDSSGESNTFTVSGTLTQNEDTPDNNFATLNPLGHASASFTLIEGNLYSGGADNNWRSIFGTIGSSSGKYYYEVKIISTANEHIGIASADQIANCSGSSGKFTDNSYGAEGYSYTNGGQKANNGSEVSWGNSYTTNDIIGVAFDLDNSKLYFSKNGTWQESGDPTSGATGTGAAYTLVADKIYLPAMASYGAASNMAFNFGNGYFRTTPVASAGTNASGNGIFEYDVPTGYTAISTKGLNS